MVIQIVLAIMAALTASALFSGGVKRKRMDYRPVLAALCDDGDDVLPPDGRWEPVNRWESVLVPCGPDDDDDDWIDLGGEG